MSQRMKVAAATLSVAALVLGGCGAPKGTGSDSAEAKMPTCPIKAFENASGPIKLNFWYGETGPPVDAVKKLVKRYNASQSKVVVTATNQGNGDEIDAKFRGALDSGQLPDFAELYDQPSAVDSGKLLPAEACMKQSGFDLSTINAAVRATGTTKGKFWPAYRGVNEALMYFNGAALDAVKLKPPTTLDELYTAAKALKAAGFKTPIALGSDRTGTTPLSELLGVWLTNEKQTLVNKDNGRSGDPTASTLDNEATKKVLDFVAKVKKESLVTPTTGVNNLYALAKGTAAITFDLSGAALGIAQVVGGDPKTAAALQSARLPGISGPVASAGEPGPGFYIVNTSKPEVQGAAWDFASFMLKQEQGVSWLKEGSYLPFQSDVATAAESYYSGGSLDGRLIAPGAAQLAAATASMPTPQLPTDVLKPIDSAMQGMLVGNTSAADALKEASSGMNAAIEQYYH